MTEPDADAEEPTGATRREGQGTPRPRPPPERLARGTAVGRYLILDVLGAGGMGVVYAAFDPELDRKIAIKLLQAKPSGDASSGDQAWLLREAQAMARLAHPNVIAVHDVGTLPGDRVFVAMELVEGVTLRQWLKGQRRPWREVLPVMQAAGAGLAAAHAGGLVHRDFKPDNVLVGADGRVRVLDFGLARLHTDDDGPPAARTSDLQLALRSPLSESLTTAGTVVGTPEYMAPELYQGAPADARSDQFSFGVALYEALFWSRPFIKHAPRTQARKPPDTGVPAAIERVVMRAIAVERGERFPSMDALLAELAVDVGGRRRRGWLAAGAVAALAIAGGLGFALSRPRATPSQLCTGAEERLTGVWDPPTRAAIEAAFVATRTPFAAEAYAGLARALDRYAGEWTDAATASCQATQVRREQSEEVQALRGACLDQRLDELRALTRLLAAADRKLVERADTVAFGLEPVARCSDVDALRAPAAAPTEPAATVAAMHAALADCKAALLAGRYAPSIEAARKAAALADELRYPPARAEALMVAGASLVGTSSGAEAEAAFADAVYAALGSDRFDVAAGAAQAAAIATVQQSRLGEAAIWLGLARTAVARVPDDELLAHHQLEVEGVVAGARGDLPGAIAALEQALVAGTRRWGADSPALWVDEDAIAVTYAKSGAFDKARPHYERALALRQASVGPDHPDLASILTNLGPCYSHAGDEAAARAAYARALAIRERVEGPDNPTLILTLNNLADGLIKAGDATGALTYIDRAEQIAAKKLGPKNPIYQVVATTRAEALVAAGRHDEARAQYDAVLAVETDTRSPVLGLTLSSRGASAVAARAWTDAVFFEQRAIAAIEAGGKDRPDLFAPLVGLGRAHLELGRPALARPLLERAIVLGEQAQMGAADLAPVRALLERAR